jgi:UDP-N-acetylmuramate dehydrogenase
MIARNSVKTVIAFRNPCQFSAGIIPIFTSMPHIRERVNLRDFNTFRVPANCDYFTEINSVEDFQSLTAEKTYQDQKKLVLGGGSNLLFRNDFRGLVVKNNLPGIEVISDSSEQVLVRAGAGVVWHDLVMWTLDQWFGGLENLALIPGCVGAGPMQNIGAYGVELKETFLELDAYDMKTGEKRVFGKSECEFGYRESVFKGRYRDRYLIGSVTFRLNRNPKLNTSYGAIRQQLQTSRVDFPSIRDVADAVIQIRRSKLPDPAVMGNAGSFFKNPEVDAESYRRLRSEFPTLVAFPLENENFKLAAGWLIEQAGLKGYEKDGAAVHAQQALVIVNKSGNCTGDAVYELSEHVLHTVRQKYGVTLEREVNIIA